MLPHPPPPPPAFAFSLLCLFMGLVFATCLSCTPEPLHLSSEALPSTKLPCSCPWCFLTASAVRCFPQAYFPQFDLPHFCPLFMPLRQTLQPRFSIPVPLSLPMLPSHAFSSPQLPCSCPWFFLPASAVLPHPPPPIPLPPSLFPHADLPVLCHCFLPFHRTQQFRCPYNFVLFQR